MINKQEIDKLALVFKEFLERSYITENTEYHSINSECRINDTKCLEIRLNELINGLKFIVGDTVTFKNGICEGEYFIIEEIKYSTIYSSGVGIKLKDESIRHKNKWYDANWFIPKTKKDLVKCLKTLNGGLSTI